MFTGIVRHVGEVKAVRSTGAGARLVIDVGPLAEGLGTGDSVAVNGACLTVTESDREGAAFDAVAETLSRTTLGALRPGQKVNLERSLGVNDALDGHIVQGHVDGVGTVRSVGRGERPIWEFDAPDELTRQMVPKGSVCVAGVSLTLVDVSDGRFSVALIPTTLAETTLGASRPGDKVNIETDVIGKYVQRYLRTMVADGGGSLTLEKLRQAGFL